MLKKCVLSYPCFRKSSVTSARISKILVIFIIRACKIYFSFTFMLSFLSSNSFGFGLCFCNILKIYICIEKITEQKEMEKVRKLSVITLVSNCILLRYV